MGAKTAASLLKQYGSLDALLEAGRFSAEADALRLYRHVATLDATAPLPALEDREPDWAAGASAAQQLGLQALADWTRRRNRADLHPSLAYLHPTGGHPEQCARIAALLERFAVREGSPASREEIERVHDPAYVCAIERLERETWLDGDTVAGPTTWEAACSPSAARSRALERGGFALARPPGHLRDRAMGFCIFNNAAVMAATRSRAGSRPASRSWTGTSTMETAPRIVLGDPDARVRLAPPVAALPRHRRPRDERGNVLNVPLAAASDDAAYRAAFRAEVEPFVTRFEPDLVVVSAGFDAYRLDPLAGMELTAAGFWLAAACSRSRPGWRASSREATSPKRCQTWSQRRSRASSRVLRGARPLWGRDRETAGDAAPAVSFRFHPRKPLGLRPLSIRPGRPVRHRPRRANGLAPAG